MNYKVIVISLLIITLPLGLWYSVPPAEGSSGGRPMSDWIAATRSASPADRLSAARALGEIGRKEYEEVKGTRMSLMVFHERFMGSECYAPQAPPLILLLKDPDPSVRSAAVDGLVGMKEYADDDLLRTALDTRDDEMGWGIILVYMRAMKTGRDTKQIFSGTDGGHKLMDLAQRPPPPSYVDLVNAERSSGQKLP